MINRKNKKMPVESRQKKKSTEKFYNQDGSISSVLLKKLRHGLLEKDIKRLEEITSALHPAELGDLLTALQLEERHFLIELLADSFNFSALTEVDTIIWLDLVDSLPASFIAGAIAHLNSDDAVYLLGKLDIESQDRILNNISYTERVRLRRSLDYPQETVGRRMQTEYVSVSPSWAVSQAIDYMRQDHDLPERFKYIFVTDDKVRLIGVVPLDRILRAQPCIKIHEIMDESYRAIPATLSQEEAAREFQKYSLLSAPVLDGENRLVGVVTVDDMVDVIEEAASEDLLRMGGVGDEKLSDSIIKTSRSRAPWLFVNLMTAFLAASVIGLFDHTIEQIVALAVLMPVVAGMGGNAGCQTMTVTVRALANRALDIHNPGRVIRREIGVGIINGIIFALLMSFVAALWFKSADLGGIIAAAMIINMFAAALAGILIPLLLNRLGVDPAVASSVFVTTVTDVIGFFSFLGLATWWFSPF